MAGLDAVVLGAGVIGLTSAVRMAEAGLAVECWTAEPPARTTSRVAGALWAGSPLAGADGRLTRWARASLDAFGELAGEQSSGVRVAHGVVASRHGAGEPPQMFPGVPMRTAAPPDGFVSAFELDAPLIDMPRYLEYLHGRLLRAGAAIRSRRVRSPAELAGHAPLVVNCSGLGSRELLPDASMEPVRGQHVVVENPGLEDFFIEDRGAQEWACWFPHGARVVLGGVAQPGAVDPMPDPVVSAGIVARCAAVEPRLAGAPVLEELVGLRPSRPWVRLEAQALGDTRWVHNYGHGRSGVSLSWGCAEEVLRIVDAMPAGGSSRRAGRSPGSR
ncbi:MAG TPA: FAD-dependent oxidoreductase [Solirubrobacteraceae bacterium]|nr:FAD-dependent oxidoreductase [Solirubrobacteraceae bacterium]